VAFRPNVWFYTYIELYVIYICVCVRAGEKERRGMLEVRKNFGRTTRENNHRCSYPIVYYTFLRIVPVASNSEDLGDFCHFISTQFKPTHTSELRIPPAYLERGFF